MNFQDFPAGSREAILWSRNEQFHFVAFGDQGVRRNSQLEKFSKTDIPSGGKLGNSLNVSFSEN